MRICAVNNANKNSRVRFGETGGVGALGFMDKGIGSYCDNSRVPFGERGITRCITVADFEKAAKIREEQEALKFSYDDVWSIAHMESLSKRLKKLAEIVNLKKMVK